MATKITTILLHCTLSLTTCSALNQAFAHNIGVGLGDDIHVKEMTQFLLQKQHIEVAVV